MMHYNLAVYIVRIGNGQKNSQDVVYIGSVKPNTKLFFKLHYAKLRNP